MNRELEAKARALAGIKGYVTNLRACPDGTPVTAEFVIGAYHQLFQIEKSFRMAKSDLQARPIYHRARDSIEAHLTIVFAALAVSRWIEHRTGWSIRKFVKTARRYRTVQIQADNPILTAADPHPRRPAPGPQHDQRPDACTLNEPTRVPHSAAHSRLCAGLMDRRLARRPQSVRTKRGGPDLSGPIRCEPCAGVLGRLHNPSHLMVTCSSGRLLDRLSSPVVINLVATTVPELDRPRAAEGLAERGAEEDIFHAEQRAD